MQWFSWGLRDWRKNLGWFPALPDRTGRLAEALTVAGQWRNFTAFPSILAIAVVSCAALCSGSRYAMEPFSMTSTFINGNRAQSQSPDTILRINGFSRADRAGGRKRRQHRRRNGDPGKTRTSDKQFRKLLLYPPELRGHLLHLIAFIELILIFRFASETLSRMLNDLVNTSF